MGGEFVVQIFDAYVGGGFFVPGTCAQIIKVGKLLLIFRRDMGG